MAKKKQQKTNEMAKIKVERIYEEPTETPFQYLKPKPIEQIPNAHLASQHLKEIENNRSSLQNEMVLIPIINTVELETNQQIETNEVLTPISELLKFINSNAKGHLIEINFLMTLIQKAHELKDLEMELLNEFTKDAYLQGYAHGKTNEESVLPNLFDEKFNIKK